MSKQKHPAITEAARQAAHAGQHLSVWSAVEAAARQAIVERKIIDQQRSEEPSGSFVGIHIINGRITDVVAANGAVRIEE